MARQECKFAATLLIIRDHLRPRKNGHNSLNKISINMWMEHLHL